MTTPRNPSYDLGYLQALRDIRAHLGVSHKDRDTLPEAKEELGVQIEFLERLISTKEKRAVAAGPITSGG